MNEKIVEVFERKILRRTCGPVKDRDHWRCRYNKDVCGLFKEPRLAVIIRIKRLGWAGRKIQCLGD
jgi:hypothetical protein